MENQGRVAGTNLTDGDSTLVRVPVPPVSTVDDLLLDETLPRLAALNAASPDGVVTNEPSVFNRAFKGLVIQSLGKAFSYASVALGLYFRLHSFGISQYGDYGIVFVYLSFFSVFAEGGIMIISIREASKYPEQIEKVLSATLILKGFLTTIVFTSGIILALFLPYSQEVKTAIVVAGISMGIVSLSGTFNVVFQSKLRFVFPTAADMSVNAIVFVGTLLIFVYAQSSPAIAASPATQTIFFYTMIGINIIANLTQASIQIIGGFRLAKVRIIIDWSYWKLILRLSLPMAVVGILGQIHLKADSVLLSLMKSSSEFAIYNVAYRVIDIISIFFTVFANTMLPVLSRFSQQAGDEYQRVIKRVIDNSLSLSIPIALGVGLIAPELVAVLGGKNYPQAALPLEILALSLISSLIDLIFTYIVIVQNRQRNLIWVYIINIIANIGLNLYAIPRYSYNGSAVATVVTETLGMFLVIIVVNRYQRALPSLGTLGRVLIASIAMVGSVLALKIVLPSYTNHFNATEAAALRGAVYIVVAIVIYGGILYLLGGVDPAIIAHIKQRIPLLNRSTKS